VGSWMPVAKKPEHEFEIMAEKRHPGLD
jgi:hypothetical protein